MTECAFRCPAPVLAQCRTGQGNHKGCPYVSSRTEQGNHKGCPYVSSRTEQGNHKGCPYVSSRTEQGNHKGCPYVSSRTEQGNHKGCPYVSSRTEQGNHKGCPYDAGFPGGPPQRATPSSRYHLRNTESNDSVTTIDARRGILSTSDQRQEAT